MTARRSGFGTALTLLALALWPRGSWSSPAVEARVFTDLSASPSRGWPARPFLLFEDRFRATGLVYLKTSAGARLSPTSWLDAAAYYAHVDDVLNASNDELAVGDLSIHRTFGPVALKVRLGNEWHEPAGFYRYRQLHEARIAPSQRVSAWARGEFRVDADGGRITMNNLLGGVDFGVGEAGRLGFQVDWESSRRGSEAWSGVVAPGLVLASAW